jgi:hypothetical protein
LKARVIESPVDAMEEGHPLAGTILCVPEPKLKPSYVYVGDPTQPLIPTRPLIHNEASMASLTLFIVETCPHLTRDVY